MESGRGSAHAEASRSIGAGFSSSLLSRARLRAREEDRMPPTAVSGESDEHQDAHGHVANLSVIIPTLNEETTLAATLRQARQPGVHEIIVVDGGSTDATRALAAAAADVVFSAPRGRAAQMNAGAARAGGAILLFLHADTLLPEGFADVVTAACMAPGVIGGRFDVRLEPSSPLLWLTGELINLRSRLSRIATGDQAIFILRSAFARLGGYADIPLMED